MVASFLSLQVGANERPQATFPTPLPRPTGQRPQKKLVSPLLSLTSVALEHVNLHLIQLELLDCCAGARGTRKLF